jgi:hypothetical protein
MADNDRTYIAGPMTGYPEFNFPAFYAKAAEERAKGHVVINPAELDDQAEEGLGLPWDFYLRRDLKVIADCNRIVLLPGWTRSKGAQLEHTIAQALGFQIVYPPVDYSAPEDYSAFATVNS